MKFGEQILAERKKQGISVQEFAKTCGTSRSYITLIESGKRLPGKKLLPKISKALGINVTVVLNWYLEDIRLKIHKDIETS